MADEKPIIVIKKVAGHGGHHGGAWKVAYADFITAMMAFFLVMWIVGSTSDATKAGIADYFNNPINDSGFFNTSGSSTVVPGNSGILDHPFSPHDTTKSDMPYEKTSAENTKNNDEIVDIKEGFFKSITPVPIQDGDKEVADEEVETKDLEDEEITEDISKIKIISKSNASVLSDKLKEVISRDPILVSSLGEIEIQVEPDGIVFEVMDSEQMSMFESGSAIITRQAKESFIKIFNMLEQFTNQIEILGHTDATPYNSKYAGGYSNWELSTDRANAARRLIRETKIPDSRIVGVIGRADKYPRIATDPYSPANRRIAIKLRFEEENKPLSPDKIKEGTEGLNEVKKDSQDNVQSETQNSKVSKATTEDKEQTEEVKEDGTEENENIDESTSPSLETSQNLKEEAQQEESPDGTAYVRIEALDSQSILEPISVTPTLIIPNR